MWRAQRKALFAAEAARVAAKDLKSMEQTPAPATAAATAAPAKAEAKAAAKAKAKAKPATVQQKRKAKALRCLNCRKADRACKLQHCMNKAQRKACISCPKGVRFSFDLFVSPSFVLMFCAVLCCAVQAPAATNAVSRSAVQWCAIAAQR